MSKKVAVILSGCGFLDGAEIRESVLTLLALSEAGADVQCFAPDSVQNHTINHLRGEEQGATRNMLEESARIARGDIKPLSAANPNEFDAAIFPGGFGVAKNLCTFAFEGSGGNIHPDVRKFTTDFHSAGKPIGAICIAPALMALLFGKEGITVTIGEDPETAAEIEKTGAKHQNTPVTETVVDSANKIVTTPAYMYDSAALHDIAAGIKKCVNETLNLA